MVYRGRQRLFTARRREGGLFRGFAPQVCHKVLMQSVPALLVVDAQCGLLEGNRAVPDSAAVTARLFALLSAARAAGALVVHLQNNGEPGTIDEPGSPGWLIHPKLSPLAGESVLSKTADDSFNGTRLMDILRRNRINGIAIAGLLSEMCVSATVRGALARDLEVVLVQDAHATYNLEDISCRVVSRVAEHALGDDVELADTASVKFRQPLNRATTNDT